VAWGSGSSRAALGPARKLGPRWRVKRRLTPTSGGGAGAERGPKGGAPPQGGLAHLTGSPGPGRRRGREGRAREPPGTAPPSAGEGRGSPLPPRGEEGGRRPKGPAGPQAVESPGLRDALIPKGPPLLPPAHRRGVSALWGALRESALLSRGDAPPTKGRVPAKSAGAPTPAGPRVRVPRPTGDGAG
jgi:hypothetical protein